MVGPAASYLLLRHRQFSFRCRIPSRLAGILGRRELVRALGTANPALARLYAAAIALSLPKLWVALRMAEAGELEQLIDKWFSAKLDRQWKLFKGGTFAAALIPEDADPDQRWAISRQLFQQDAELMLQRLADEYRNGSFGPAIPAAREIAGKLAEPLSGDSQAFTVLCKQEGDGGTGVSLQGHPRNDGDRPGHEHSASSGEAGWANASRSD
jgi:hypothetical protein